MPRTVSMQLARQCGSYFKETKQFFKETFLRPFFFLIKINIKKLLETFLKSFSIEKLFPFPKKKHYKTLKVNKK